ncbi:MAG: hypothetical protein JOZ82_07510 [Marmoricola sp.]|nr:hypothetical protein [Marmoricola sp.]
MREPLVVQARYRGPARSANGGYTCGALAHALGDSIGRAVSVQLSQPPPLDAGMHLDDRDRGLQLSFGGAEVATAWYAEADVEPVEGVSWDEATAASPSYPGFRSHPFPSCFACGTERPDGLRIFPGEVPAAAGGRTRVAAPWTPDRTLSADWHEYDDPARRACLAATWAALDCVGGWAGDLTERLMVLGRMTAVIDDLPVVGEPHVVVGEARGSEGRRTFTAATLHDADGRIVGRAEHVWVSVDPARFNG